MEDKKHIDRLFQEKLKNFEASPKDMVWDKVHTTLHGEKDDKKPIPLFWKVAGVAAILLLLITAGNYFFNNDGQQDIQPIVDNSELNPKEDSTTYTDKNIKNNERSDDQNYEVVSKEPLNNENNFEAGQKTNTPSEKPRTTLKLKENKTIYSNEDKLAESNNTEKEANIANTNADDVTAINSTVKNQETDDPLETMVEIETGVVEKTLTDETPAVTEETKNTSNKEVENITKLPTDVAGAMKDKPVELEENNPLNSTDSEVASLDELNEKEKEEVEIVNRWNIYPNISPVYFNTLGSGSSIDSQFNQNSKSGEINFSYGINGSYAINEKLKVRAGINKVELGYKTNDVIVYRNSDAVVNDNARLRNIRFKDSEQNTSFLSATNLSYAVIPDVIANNIKGSLDQELGFIEVPLEVEYTILKRRVGINLIGGFSAFFLNKNEVYSSLQGDRRLIGEATNINNTSYSANFGVGFNFRFTETIDINLEPTFKYQLDTFSDSSGDFQPYVIGLYSGLRFKF